MFATISFFVQTYVHYNPLQGNYRVELLHREIPVVITGSGFAVCEQFRYCEKATKIWKKNLPRCFDFIKYAMSK